MSFSRWLLMVFTIFVLGAFIFIAWGTQCPDYEELSIPELEAGKFGIALVLDGKIADNTWAQGHHDGLLHLNKFINNASVTYLEGVPENCDSGPVFRQLAQRGYRMIIGAEFGYMDAMEQAAGEFADATYINVLGLKSNHLNFDNLNGAMEDMVYLAGMVAGARARQDNFPRLGFIATLPVPEEMRMINAAALGMTRTCPECKMDVRWLYAWQDNDQEAKLADELFTAGAHVVISGSNGYGLLNAAKTKAKYGIPIGSAAECAENSACLTAAYWIWGPVYAKIAEKVQTYEYRPQSPYFHADSNGLGLYGFMDGQMLTPGAVDLPVEDIAAVRELFNRMHDPSQQAWRVVFAGPILDNAGRTIVPEGEFLNRTSTDQFPPGGQDIKCNQEACMYWFAAGITASLPDIGTARK